jgi:hypothetical protein
LRSHLESVYRQTGHKPEKLINKTCPESLVYVWEYFLVLHNTRSGGMGISGISFTEIQAWNNMLDIGITASDVELIKMLDSLFLDHYNKSQKAKK